MKYLIAGLGNIGEEYKNTRHNIGFNILDAYASASNIIFTPSRYGHLAETRFKGRTLILLKPSTYMNLSGKAINYWLQNQNISTENLLVVLDDLALPFGTIRIRPKGSDGGHNGLKNIDEIIGHSNYSRLRFGIGNQFNLGKQVDYVLGLWNQEDIKNLEPRIKLAIDAIKCFATQGVAHTMNYYNNK